MHQKQGNTIRGGEPRLDWVRESWSKKESRKAKMNPETKHVTQVPDERKKTFIDEKLSLTSYYKLYCILTAWTDWTPGKRQKTPVTRDFNDGIALKYMTFHICWSMKENRRDTQKRLHLKEVRT